MPGMKLPHRNYVYDITSPGADKPWVRTARGGCSSHATARTLKSARRWAARFGDGAIIMRLYRNGWRTGKYREWTFHTAQPRPDSKRMVADLRELFPTTTDTAS